MWATDPTSPIQLRMPPVPDPYRVFASLADSPEEMPDVPSVAQLRALWENQLAATTSPSESVGNTVYYNQHLFSSNFRSGNQDERPADVTHYVDDVAPFRAHVLVLRSSIAAKKNQTVSLDRCLGHRLSIMQMTLPLMTMTDPLAMSRSRQLRPTLTPNSTNRGENDSLK